MHQQDDRRHARQARAHARRVRADHQSLRLRAALRWTRRRLKSVDHERRVMLIAGKLFDLTAGLHRLDHQHRHMLRLGAALHDVGRRFGEKNHPAEGARMIEGDGYLPLNDRERRQICYLTRYHRGAVPEHGYDGWLKRGDDRKVMRVVLGLLRAADTLDNRSLPAPTTISMVLRGRRLALTCYLATDCSKSRKVFRRRKKFRLLEDVLGCKVDLDVRVAEAVESV